MGDVIVLLDGAANPSTNNLFSWSGSAMGLDVHQTFSGYANITMMFVKPLDVVSIKMETNNIYSITVKPVVPSGLVSSA